LYVKNIKIRLTPFENIFVSYMLENDGECNLISFHNFLLNLTNRKTKRRSLVVYIGRLRKKIIYATGYNIIKSRYKFGYYIDCI